MAALAAMAGAAGLLAGRSGPRVANAGTVAVVSRGFLIGLLVILAAVALQLVPLPLHVLVRLNGNLPRLLRDLDPAFAFNPGPHALSAWPPGTRIALGLLAALSLFLVGTTRLVSSTGARRLIEMVIVLGVVVALVGVALRPLHSGKIYGFWTTEEGGAPFGPFVNRDHFAGWMLMAIPLALGYLCASLAKGLRGVKPDWHHRLVWLSSPAASWLMMVAFGIAVMALALVLTLSRSGISALGVAVAITGWFVVKRFQGRGRKLIALGYLALLSTLVLGWVGFDTIASRFAAANWGQLEGRSGAWADAVATFRRHWQTGTGLNTYQVVNLVYQQHDRAHIVSAAHGDYFQLAAEGGLLLIVPLLLCTFFFVRDVRRRFREDGESSAYWLRVGAVTGLVAIGIQEVAEFSLQIPGNAALFAVVCAIALHRSPRGRRAR